MINLLINEDSSQKQQQISALKIKTLPNANALKFDYDVLYGHHLSAQDLKKSLISLPAIAPQRLIVIYESEKLREDCKDVLTAFFASKPSHAVVVFDAMSLPDKDVFWNAIRAQAQVFEVKKSAKENVFDMTRKMHAGRIPEALQILNQLFDDGVHPLQIMGGVVWAWGNERSRISPNRFQRGLRDLQEADLNIKRSRMDPEQALEVLLVKLAQDRGR